MIPLQWMYELWVPRITEQLQRERVCVSNEWDDFRMTAARGKSEKQNKSPIYLLLSAHQRI